MRLLSKFRNFRDIFILANNVKRHIYDVKNSQVGHGLPISVIKRVILPFFEGFYFHQNSHMRSFAKNKPLAIFGMVGMFIFSLASPSD